MVNSTRLKQCVLALAIAGLLGAPIAAFGEDEDALTAAALGLVEAKASELGFRDPNFHLAFGDLTGQGTADAVAFIYHASGGSGEMLTTWILRETDGAYTIAREVSNEELFGYDPRNVQISPGRVSVTTTVLQGDDPRCCPTGTRTFIIEAE